MSSKQTMETAEERALKIAEKLIKSKNAVSRSMLHASPFVHHARRLRLHENYERRKSVRGQSEAEREQTRMRKAKSSTILKITEDPVQAEDRRQKAKLESFVKRQNLSEKQKERIRFRKLLDYTEDKDRLYARNEKWRHSLSDEKKERYKESLSKANKKYYEKIKADPEKYREFLTKGSEKMKQRRNEETPEEREWRCFRYRVNFQKFQLKKKLNAEGHSPEEIEKMVAEFVVKYKAEHQPPKPESRRQKGRKLQEKKCDDCGATFLLAMDLVQHKVAEHPKIKCDICSEPFVTKKELKIHMETHLNRERLDTTGFHYFCMKCYLPSCTVEWRFLEHAQLLQHVEQFHRRSYWPCGKCNLLKYSKISLAVHEAFCRPENPRVPLKRKACKKSYRRKRDKKR